MNIGIVGLGLMGASLARTIVKKGEHKVYGTDISDKVMLKAELLGCISQTLTTENANELDMLVVATRPEYFSSIVDEYLPHLKAGAILTDFCGTKRNVISIMRECQKFRSDIVYVGGHPMAGRELSGIDHSKQNLFDKASMILVPVTQDLFALEKVKAFYLSLGFLEVVITDAENHDAMIAFTSQLCHIVSNAFIKNKTADKHFGYSAGSYKDLTRVARLDADMWSGLMTANADKLLPELNEFIENVSLYRDALKDGDEQKLKELLKEGNDKKIAIDVKNTKG